jgi:hypothetical protein
VSRALGDGVARGMEANKRWWRGGGALCTLRGGSEAVQGGETSGGELAGVGKQGRRLVARRGKLTRGQQRGGVGPGRELGGRLKFLLAAHSHPVARKPRRRRCRAPAGREVEEGRWGPIWNC